LTINEENRLKAKVNELTEKQDEIALLKLEHRQEMKQMREDMNQVMLMIQENPQLAHIKPERLSRKFT
jgi:hypothetical protein